MQLRTVRTVTLDVMRTDYVRTAWAKGTPERRVMFRHAFRNGLIPVVTIIGNSVAGLIGGSVILENIFGIPGIGNQVISAIGNRDYPLVQGCVLVFALFTMVVNLLVDISYKWIDPRVSLDKEGWVEMKRSKHGAWQSILHFCKTRPLGTTGIVFYCCCF